MATRAVDSYLTGKFKNALGFIEKAFRFVPDDRALEIIAARCREYLATPPQGEWDGIYVYHEK